MKLSKLLTLACIATLAWTPIAPLASAAPPRGRKAPAAKTPAKPEEPSLPVTPELPPLRPKQVDQMWHAFSMQLALAAERDSIDRMTSGIVSVGASAGLMTGGILAMDHNEDFVTGPVLAAVGLVFLGTGLSSLFSSTDLEDLVDRMNEDTELERESDTTRLVRMESKLRVLALNDGSSRRTWGVVEAVVGGVLMIGGGLLWAGDVFDSQDVPLTSLIIGGMMLGGGIHDSIAGRTNAELAWDSWVAGRRDFVAQREGTTLSPTLGVGRHGLMLSAGRRF